MGLCKNIVKKWKELLVDKITLIDRKEMEKDRGLVYPVLVPYLKGFHLTLAMWRPDRDEQGWKLHRNDWARLQVYFEDRGIEVQTPSMKVKDAPVLLKRAPRLENDLLAMSTLLKDDFPPA